MQLLNRLKWNKLFSFIILLLFTSQVFSQTPFLRKYTVDDGLPSSHVYRVYQDSEGFIWVCTDRGLSRFDGYKFENFTTKTGLPYNDIWNIAEDNQKRLWIASYLYAFTYYDINNRRFHVIKNDKYPAIGQFSTSAFFPYLDKILVTSSSTPIIFNPKNDSFFQPKERTLEMIEFPSISSEFIEANYNIYLFRENYLNYNFEYFLKRGSTINSSYITENKNVKEAITGYVCFEDKKDIYYTEDSQIISISGQKLQLKDKIGRVERIGKTDLLTVFTAKEVIVIDRNLRRLHNFDFINQYKVNSLYIDNEQNTWICTKDMGLLFLPGSSNSFYFYDELFGSGIKTMTEDKDGDLWLGTDKGELYVVRDKSVQKIKIQGTINAPVRKIKISMNQDVWVSYEKLLLQRLKVSFKNAKNKIELAKPIVTTRGVEISTPTNKVTYSEQQVIKSFAELSDSTFFLGTSFFIMKSINKKHDFFKQAIERGNIKPLCMTVDSKNSLWIGSTKGIYRFSNNVLDDFSVLKDENEILSKTINDILVINDDVWVGTDGFGLYKFSGSALVTIKELDGRIINNLFFEKVKKRIWVATNEGVFVVSLLPQGKYLFDKILLPQGLPTLEVHSVFARGDKLFAGTKVGLSAVNLSSFFESGGNEKVVFPIAIKKVSINGQDTTYQDNYNLKYTQNSINIDFVALSYKSDKNIKYQYKLVSEESNITWKEIQDTKLAFNYLSPGNYKFYLRAFDIEGNETILSKPIIFQINPPYWQTWWFRILIGLSLVGIIGGFTFWYRKNTEKNLQVSKKLAELELHALQSQMNPHFVFNALTSIQNFILNKDINAANEYLASFSRLIRLFLESSRNRYISIAEEKILLEKYIQLEQARFRNKFTYEITDINLVESSQEIPSMLLQPFVENAINHGLVYKEGTGHLSITFKNENQYLYCTIEDDGVGRKKAKELRTRAIKAYKSRATEIIDERLRTLKMVDGTEVSVNIVDKVDENNINTGTKVEIIILMS